VLFGGSVLLCFLILSSEGCQPHVDVSHAAALSLPECQGYVEKHVVDDQGYLSLTLITPPVSMPDAASQPRSYLLTFRKQIGGPGFLLDHASKHVIADADPQKDTVLILKSDQICLDPGPQDTSEDMCLAAWIKAAGAGAKCLKLTR